MKPALVLIDVQNEYFKPYGKRVLPDGEKALEHVLTILKAARDSRIPVFHVVHHALSADAHAFRVGESGASIHPAIEVLPGERLIEKHFPGSFSQTPLEAHLRQQGVDTVIIAGFMTHMCCDTTARQARERGLEVFFLSDATASHDLRLGDETISHEVIHRSTLAVIASFGARVMTVGRAMSMLTVE